MNVPSLKVMPKNSASAGKSACDALVSGPRATIVMLPLKVAIFKLEFITRQENHSGYAIECFDLTQGLMMVETQLHGSRDLIGKRLVYIEALTSAPWNRKEIHASAAIGDLRFAAALRYR